MNDRIFEIRKFLNLTQNEFGEQIGMTGSTISDIEHKRCSVTNKTIIAVCSKFHINENWLRTGQGEMILEYDKKHDEFFSLFQNLNPVLQDFLIKTAKNLLDAQSKL